MFRIVLLVFFFTTLTKAQTLKSDTSNVESFKKSEFNIDILQLILVKRINVTYERLLKNNTSISINPIIFEGVGFSKPPTWVSLNDDTHSIQIRYNFYVNSRKKHHGFAFFPLIKYSTSLKGYPVYETSNKSSKISDLMLGTGIQWKYILKNKLGFSFGIYIQNIFFSKKLLNRNVLNETNLNLSTTFNFRF